MFARRTSLTGAALLVLLGLLALIPTPASGAADGTVWVVDAVDDEAGNRWQAEATGDSALTIAPGDTVEWQFDEALIEHDLTSEDSRSAWAEPVQEYRTPGGAAVRRTFTEPGEYWFLCSLHGVVMRGVVRVEDPAANRLPVGTATATPATGAAPLDVHFTADVTDPDGDPLTYTWDFGDGTPADAVTGAHALHTYTAQGSYVAAVEVADGRGGVLRQELPVTVGSAPVEPPSVHAHADHAAGTAPLPVAFSTEVGTDGTFAPYADGLATYPDLSGTATLVRSRGETRAVLDVTGLAPNASHLVHVHEQACGSAAHGGAHFRFDETQPFAAENELWLPFTSDAAGASGEVVASQPIRAGAKAVSIVIHDPDNPAKRIGCADLAPGTADLTYAWDFGDGGTATGPDPDHTYTAPGSYLATVAVSGPGSAAVTSDVDVVVGVPVDEVAPQTTVLSGPSGTVRARSARFLLGSSEAGGSHRCRLDAGSWLPCAATVTFQRLRDGPHRLAATAVDAAGNADPTPAVRTWIVDTTGPSVGGISPTGGGRDRTPVVRARVVDRWSAVRSRDVLLWVDGRRMVVRYDAGRRLVRAPVRRALAPGRHRVRLVVRDALGNASVRTWTFRVRR